KAVGEPIKGYFPAIVSEATFHRVEEGLKRRKKGGGPTTGTPNLFNGLLFDAFDGLPMVINGSGAIRHLVSRGAIRKAPGSVYRSIRYQVFEDAILGQLAELKAADVLGKPNEAQDRAAALSGKLTALNRKIDQVRAKAAAAEDVSIFFDLITDLDRE